MLLHNMNIPVSLYISMETRENSKLVTNSVYKVSLVDSSKLVYILYITDAHRVYLIDDYINVLCIFLFL